VMVMVMVLLDLVLLKRVLLLTKAPSGIGT